MWKFLRLIKLAFASVLYTKVEYFNKFTNKKWHFVTEKFRFIKTKISDLIYSCISKTKTKTSEKVTVCLSVLLYKWKQIIDVN